MNDNVVWTSTTGQVAVVMTANDSALGRCPHCDEAIPSHYMLIEYERATGERAWFAECPGCRAVVAPQ